MAQDQLVEILDFKEVVKRVKTLDMVVADYIKEFDMVLVFVDQLHKVGFMVQVDQVD